jgi:hypothetical protein
MNTLILKIKEKGFYINIPGVPPTRSPTDLDITKINLNLVLSFLRSSGIEDFTIISKTESEERIIRSKDILFDKKEKGKIVVDNKEVEKRLDRLENMISKLISTKSDSISKDQIKNKLDFLEVLIKNINIPEQNIQYETKGKEPEIEEFETFIPEINVSGLLMKGDYSKEIIQSNNDIDETANLLSKLLNREKSGGEK